ncbi:MAG TPA: cytochrome b [Burkholderiaceae bacterium]|nr:cytochrome b [Burkholderiaceae bacterium]
MQVQSDGRYTMPVIALHWLMALLLFVQIGIGWYMVDIPKRTPPVAFYYNLHKSLGLLAFALVVVRLWWKFRSPSPSLNPLHQSPVLAKAAEISHRLLYVCMLMTPVCGFVASSFTKHSINFFGWPLPRLGWDDPLISSVFKKLHFGFSYLLFFLICIHLTAVLYHLATSGTQVIRRMLPRT